VCPIQLDDLEAISREVPALQKFLDVAMSREIVRAQSMLVSLGSLQSEERLAGFLINLVHRLQSRGFSGSELVLRMTRSDIGSYLGMTLETVSRTFASFAQAGLLDVQTRHLRLLNVAALHDIASPPCYDKPVDLRDRRERLPLAA
jgi:CRP/FNR family transcriptional regulator